MCEHMEFRAEVTVSRVQHDAGMRFVADVRVCCAGCGQRFKFTGLPHLISTRKPGISATGLEASLPIEPFGPHDRFVAVRRVVVDME